jgi:catechol 2,3-dioxygenase-like lactoylglutathione lyase family enzyme
MEKPRFGFVVEYVKDIEASKRFFEDVLGLKMERYHPTFIQFDKFAIATDKPIGATGEPEVCWLVDDAEAAYRELSQKAEVSSPLTQKPLGKIFAIKDADGRPRFLLELSRERPSQAVK